MAAKSNGNGTRVSARRKAELDAIKSRRDRRALILLGSAILLLFIILIKGSNIWLAFHSFIMGLFGIFTMLWVLYLIYASIRNAFSKPEQKLGTHLLIIGFALVFFYALVFLISNGFAISSERLSSNFTEILFEAYERGTGNAGGGFIGALVGGVFMRLFGITGALVTIILLIFIFFMITTRTSLSRLYHMLAKPVTGIQSKNTEAASSAASKAKAEKPGKNSKKETAPAKAPFKEENELFNLERPTGKSGSGPLVGDEWDILTHTKKSKRKRKSETAELQNHIFADEGVNINHDAIPIFDPFAGGIGSGKTEVLEPMAEASPELEALAAKAAKRKPSKEAKDDFSREVEEAKSVQGKYTFPPISFLKHGQEASQGNIAAELKYNGELLVKTLQDFNIATKIVDISRGPAVTRYELQPAPGVKISKITGLSDDIALNLAASGVRIEAPIPGKSAVGIEIPNKVVSIVHTRSIIESDAFKRSESRLTMALGKDISGAISIGDIAKMPHLLIAGSTGSGKSVCINSIIISLLYKSSSDEVKLLMIDPKVVELGIYNGIPHLIVPVVTEPKKAASALAWAVSEMLKRYQLFADNNVRDLNGYNRIAAQSEELERLPQIVIIIDELADLMMVAKKEVEDYIGRLTQMARAAGMHLIVATQRPSVDVITGVIKANIPSRIAFAVSSQVDSRTILDGGGAEKLIGRGDMLFMPVGSNKPTRIQGCYVTDREIEDVVKFIKESSESNYDEAVAIEIETKAMEAEGSGGDTLPDNGTKDPMFNQAVECVLEAGQASTSLLQRKLRLGYARAGRLIDELERAGVVGPYEGSKPRQVVMTRAEWLERIMHSK
ncbi:MAG: DNA translocase FtsK [Oscillospiraceae bacterium]|jgi:S-DNA-T family DNA segregation ATPase FtsK/SpoIIIE|nr:DNA translocase FtsK [Oscillospiraceae bacterium]